MKLLLCAIAFSLVISQGAGGEETKVRSAATAWKELKEVTTNRGSWLVFSREALLAELEPSISARASQEEIRRLLGDPESDWQYGNGAVWTYGLHRRKFFQLFFDKNSRLVSTQKRAYRSARELEEGGVAEAALTAEETEMASHIGAWRAMIGRDAAHADRVHMGSKVASYVQLGMSSTAVERHLGRPASEVKGACPVWTYRLGRSDFVQIAFSAENKVIAVGQRSYARETGKLTATALCGDFDDISDAVLDRAAWLATWAGYTILDDRIGIGKRMVTHLKLGMTREEVLELLGDPWGAVYGNRVIQHGPDDIYSDPAILREATTYDYLFWTTDYVSLDFGADGKVSQIRQ